MQEEKGGVGRVAEERRRETDNFTEQIARQRALEHRVRRRFSQESLARFDSEGMMSGCRRLGELLLEMSRLAAFEKVKGATADSELKVVGGVIETACETAPFEPCCASSNVVTRTTFLVVIG